jgi:hypothetical protein
MFSCVCCCVVFRKLSQVLLYPEIFHCKILLSCIYKLLIAYLLKRYEASGYRQFPVARFSYNEVHY